MRMGRNMKAVMGHVRAEPGRWTALTLSRDFDITERSVRRTLRVLETLGLVIPKAQSCDSCGHVAVHYFPVGTSTGGITPPKV